MPNQRRWKIDPSKTAMENLYDACSTACKSMMLKTRVRWRNDDERQEMLDLHTYRGVEVFLDRYIRGKRYNRKFTFFQNVYSACWSCYTDVLTRYLNIIKRQINTTDKMETVTYNQDEHPLGLYNKYERGFNSYEKESLDFSYLSACSAEAAFKYVWQCEDEAAKEEHRTVDWLAIDEHRANILQKLHEKYDDGRTARQLHKRAYNREYQRKRRARLAGQQQRLGKSQPESCPPVRAPSLRRSKCHDTPSDEFLRAVGQLT